MNCLKCWRKHFLEVETSDTQLAGLDQHSRIQIGTIRPIRVDHTNFFKWLLKLIHSNNIYILNTSDEIYDDYSRLLSLDGHREASALVHELPEESDQFRFLRAASLANLKGSIGLILTKA